MYYFAYYVDACYNNQSKEGVAVETIHISDNNIRISILLNDNKIFYINHSYSEDAQISVSHNNDTIINEDYSVYGKVPKKVFIPTVFEKENSVQMSK